MVCRGLSGALHVCVCVCVCVSEHAIKLFAFWSRENFSKLHTQALLPWQPKFACWHFVSFRLPFRCWMPHVSCQKSVASRACRMRRAAATSASLLIGYVMSIIIHRLSQTLAYILCTFSFSLFLFLYSLLLPPFLIRSCHLRLREDIRAHLSGRSIRTTCSAFHSRLAQRFQGSGKSAD